MTNTNKDATLDALWEGIFNASDENKYKVAADILGGNRNFTNWIFETLSDMYETDDNGDLSDEAIEVLKSVLDRNKIKY